MLSLQGPLWSAVREGGGASFFSWKSAYMTVMCVYAVMFIIHYRLFDWVYFVMAMILTVVKMEYMSAYNGS